MKKKVQLPMAAITLTIAGVLFTGCSQKITNIQEKVDQKNQSLGVSVHDPSIEKENGTYYLFGSHMDAAITKDFQNFQSIASGVGKNNPLFDNLFDGDKKAFEFTGKFSDGKYAVWAPDVIYNPVMKKYMMYFATSHDYRTSAIHFAVADAVDGPYHYMDTLLYSGFNRSNVDKTNLHEILGKDASISKYLQSGQYNNMNDPNCIDPQLLYDKDDRLWMVYGSWSGGIFLLEIDQATGQPIHPEMDKEKKIDAYFGRYLIGGLHNSCEGPCLIYNKDNDMYYLFVSYGELQREGGYQIRQFRSKSITGPYVDTQGNTLSYTSDHSQFGLKMVGNYKLPSLSTAYMAPGHNSILKEDDGSYYICYHQRFDNNSEYHEPRIHRLYLNEEEWFVMAPFAAPSNETNNHKIDTAKLCGQYSYVNHGTDISSEIHSSTEILLKENGEIFDGKHSIGRYQTTDDTNTIHLTVNDHSYSGVIDEMLDEAGNKVCFITASGDNNETIWMVKYLLK